MVVQHEDRSGARERASQGLADRPIDSESLVKLKMLLQGPSISVERREDNRSAAVGFIE